MERDRERETERDRERERDREIHVTVTAGGLAGQPGHRWAPDPGERDGMASERERLDGRERVI